MKFEFELPKYLIELLEGHNYTIQINFDSNGSLIEYDITIHREESHTIKPMQELVSKFRRIEGTKVEIRKESGSATIVLPEKSKGWFGNRITVYGIAEVITLCNEDQRQRAIQAGLLEEKKIGEK